MARSLWICPRRAGPAAEEKQEDDQGRQADRKTDRKGGAGGGRGNYGAGTSPAGALAHVPCCHTKGGSIRVGLKDGGKRERYYLFIFFPPPPFEQVPLYGEATLKSWGAVLLYALVCGMTNQPIKKRGVGRCTYMVKPPGVFPERFVRAVGEGEPGRCT